MPGANGKKELLDRESLKAKAQSDLESLRAKVQSDTVDLKGEYLFEYKGRRTVGKAIHLAAYALDDQEGSRYIQRLLEAKADVQEFCCGERLGKGAADYKVQSFVQAIHLAAGQGRTQVMELLIEHKPRLLVSKTRQRNIDLDAPLDGREALKADSHYGVLHEAVWCSSRASEMSRGLDAVTCLLKLGDRFAKARDVDVDVADIVDMTNNIGQTPLHIAASVQKNSSASSCHINMIRLLRRHGADTTRRDLRMETPLISAIAKGQPKKVLIELLTPTLAELGDAAEENTRVALELLKSEDIKWRKALMEQAKLPPQDVQQKMTEDLAKLIERYPRVAGKLLELLTVEPEEQKPWEYPLPRYAKRGSIRSKKTLYMEDHLWKEREDREVLGENFPTLIAHRVKREKMRTKMRIQTHDCILPAGSSWSSSSSDEDPEESEDESESEMAASDPWEAVRMKIQVLHFPNIVSCDIMKSLAECKNVHTLNIFRTVPAQTIVEFAWTHCVRYAYTVDILIRGLELAALFYAATLQSISQEHYAYLWHAIVVLALREFCWEVCQLRGYLVRFGSLTSYVSFMNIMDWVSISLLTCYALTQRTVSADGMSRSCRRLLAGLSILKWYQVLRRLTAHRCFKQHNLGAEITTVFQSMFKIGGIMIITLVLFLAFVQAYVALGVGQGDNEDLFLQAFRLLIMGDSEDAFVQDFAEGGAGGKQVPHWVPNICFFATAAVFCIIVMNLFIAGLSEAFAEIKETRIERYFANLADICMESMVLPTWPYGVPTWNYARVKVYLLILLGGFLVGIVLNAVEGPLRPLLLTIWPLFVLLVGDCVLRGTPGQRWNPHWCDGFDPANRHCRRQTEPRYLMWCVPLGEPSMITDSDPESDIEMEERFTKVEQRMETLEQNISKKLDASLEQARPAPPNLGLRKASLMSSWSIDSTVASPLAPSLQRA